MSLIHAASGVNKCFTSNGGIDEITLIKSTLYQQCDLVWGFGWKCKYFLTGAKIIKNVAYFLKKLS